ncbi:MAG: S9 family peptidase [Hyphomicrobiaceae bacterium]
MSAPIAKKVTVTSHWHGIALNDDYHWMRAANWQEAMRDPATLPTDIRAYLEAENAYAEATLADTEALQEALFQEMKARIKEDDSSVPAPDGAWSYYTSFVTGGQYPLLCRKPRSGGQEFILIDGNREAEDAAYWQLGGASHSPDHSLMVYGVDQNGSEYFTLRIRDLETGSDLSDTIPDTAGGAVWVRDSRTFYYQRLDANHRPLQVFRHTIGSSVQDDVLIYEERDPGFGVGIGETQSGDFIIFDASDHETNEVYVLDAHDPGATPKMIAPRRSQREYSIDHHGDKFYILTNSGGAEDFRVCTASVSSPGEENWAECIPHQKGTLILGLTLFKNHMVRMERARSLPRVVIRRLSDQVEHEIAFDEKAYSLGISPGYEYDTTTIRFSYASMTTPAQVFDYDMETRDRILRKTQEVPSGHEPSNYVTDRLFAEARDGAIVPISVLYHKDTPLDGTAPLCLYGYGSYGISIPASFSTTRLSLVDRGFVFALAHVRGGKDMGFHWYSDGKRAKKQNTFTDFIDCAKYLSHEGYAGPGRIVASGGSAGGLLVGAVANMAPELFLGIVANVPFVDTLNTILDETLPLTPMEWPEWGNPISSLEDFKTIQAYSPYDNVSARAYPHILALAGISDPRVTYWEPAKWVAKLRVCNTSDNLILLKTNMDAGHGGASGRFEALREVALEYAFALKISGLARG